MFFISLAVLLVLNSKVFELFVIGLILCLIFPNFFSTVRKGFSWSFEILKQTLVILLKVLAKALELVGYVLKQVLTLIASLFGRR